MENTESKQLSKEREHYVADNINLVYSVVNKMCYGLPYKIDMEDLIQEGYMGLIKAAINFDETAGIQFSTYAVTSIRRTVCRYIGNNAYDFSISQYYRDKYNEYKKLQNEMSNSEIAETLGCTEYELEYFKRLTSCVSGDDMLTDDSDITIMNNVKDCNIEMIYSDIERDELIDAILNAISNKLGTKQLSKSKMIYLYYIEQLMNGTFTSYVDIAKTFNVSRQLVTDYVTKVNKEVKHLLRYRGITPENELE